MLTLNLDRKLYRQGGGAGNERWGGNIGRIHDINLCDNNNFQSVKLKVVKRRNNLLIVLVVCHGGESLDEIERRGRILAENMNWIL